MTLPIELDDRFIVNRRMIEDMKKLRKDGHSYQYIANQFNISQSTALYWLNEETRNKQRKKNAKRPGRNEYRSKIHNQKKKLFREEFALGYIAKQVQTYQHKKRDVLILGVSMKNHWIPYLKKNYYKGRLKII